MSFHSCACLFSAQTSMGTFRRQTNGFKTQTPAHVCIGWEGADSCCLNLNAQCNACMCFGGTPQIITGPGENALLPGRRWEQRQGCQGDRAAPRKPQPREQTGQRAPGADKS